MITQTLPRAIPHPRPGWGLWAAWALATTGGGGASLITLYTIPILTFTNELSMLPWVILIAMIISLAQWPILHRYLPALSPRQWLGANVLGYLVGLIAGWACLFVIDWTRYATVRPGWDTRPTWDLLMLAAAGAGAGGTLALIQWRALRPYLRGARYWIGANASAWSIIAVAMFLYQRIGFTYGPTWMVRSDPSPAETLSNLTDLPVGMANAMIIGSGAGLLLGALTGLALAALIRARPEETA